MPTGYTAAIKDGISFEKFVMNCARAMGACVTMRDDPFNAEIPNKFEPSDYYSEKIKETKDRLERLKVMSNEEILAAAKEEFEKAVSCNNKQIVANNDLREKYQDMLEQVNKWQPPSPDHHDFKKFMIEQITSSIKFDCNNSYYLDNPPKFMSEKEWLTQQYENLLHDLDYYTKENQKEIERAHSRTTWIEQLRESL